MILRVLSVSVCVLFAVSSANAQCVGCAGSAPMFNQAMAAPMHAYAVNSMPAHAPMMMNTGCGCASMNVGMTHMTYTSAPMTGCQGCGQAHVVSMPQMTYTSAPVQSGCAGCGDVAPVATGCSGCASNVWHAPVQGYGQCCDVQPRRSFRVNVLGGRRNNCCY